jgi:type IV secretory pathway TrbD component
LYQLDLTNSNHAYLKASYVMMGDDREVNNVCSLISIVLISSLVVRYWVSNNFEV